MLPLLSSQSSANSDVPSSSSPTTSTSDDLESFQTTKHLTFNDLPESIYFLIIQYLVSPIHYSDAMAFLFINKLCCMTLQRYLQHEINLALPGDRRLQLPVQEATLKLYYSILSPKILILGGMQDNRRCDVFHTWSGKFQRVCGLSLKRNDEFTATMFRGYVLVISGSDDSAIATVEKYNTITNKWSLMPPLPRHIVACSVIVFEDNLYVIGGIDRTNGLRSENMFKLTLFDSYLSYNELVDTCEAYWTLTEHALIQGRSHHGVAQYRGGIWVAGGLVTGQFTATNSVEVLIGTNFVLGPPMLRKRLQPTLLVIDGELYAVGGDMEGTSQSVCSIERFDEVKETWMFVTFFPEPRRRTKCSVSSCEQRIYVFGGSDGSTLLTSWDYYDIRGKFWASQMQQNLLENDTRALILTPEEEKRLKKMDFSTINGRSRGLKSAVAVNLTL